MEVPNTSPIYQKSKDTKNHWGNGDEVGEKGGEGGYIYICHLFAGVMGKISFQP